jgi:hypothetical protein
MKGFDWLHDPSGIAVDRPQRLSAAALAHRWRPRAGCGGACAAGTKPAAAPRGRTRCGSGSAGGGHGGVEVDKTGRRVEHQRSRSVARRGGHDATNNLVADGRHAQRCSTPLRLAETRVQEPATRSRRSAASAVEGRWWPYVLIARTTASRCSKLTARSSEAHVAKDTKGDGRWDGVFAGSEGAVVADGHNKTIWMLDRASLSRSGVSATAGAIPALYGVGSIAVDSKGNVYTGETYDGKRVQKFVKK